MLHQISNPFAHARMMLEFLLLLIVRMPPVRSRDQNPHSLLPGDRLRIERKPFGCVGRIKARGVRVVYHGPGQSLIAVCDGRLTQQRIHLGSSLLSWQYFSHDIHAALLAFPVLLRDVRIVVIWNCSRKSCKVRRSLAFKQTFYMGYSFIVAELPILPFSFVLKLTVVFTHIIVKRDLVSGIRLSTV